MGALESARFDARAPAIENSCFAHRSTVAIRKVKYLKGGFNRELSRSAWAIHSAAVRLDRPYLPPKEPIMRFAQILPIALLGLTAATPMASAAVISVPTPALDSGFLTIADRQMEVAVPNTHLRSAPTSSSTKLATLKTGTKVDVIEMVNNGTWAHV